MKTAGIIAEYNPFHKGHQYQIDKLRRETGADFVIAAMSGDFVQRGEPALIDKYTRTEMALSEGIDLVLELPVRYATASAERFARGGVALLASTGVVDTLGFGVEPFLCRGTDSVTDDRDAYASFPTAAASHLAALQELAQLLCEEPQEYRKILQRELSLGHSFPAARKIAAASVLASRPAHPVPSSPLSPGQTASLLDAPNNILATEYLKALSAFPQITPVLIPRMGDDYHTKSPESSFASATALRSMLLSGGNGPQSTEPYIPRKAHAILQSFCAHQPLLTGDDLSAILGYRLQSLAWETPGSLAWEQYCRYMDCSPPLAHRIAEFLPRYQSFSQFCGLLKTRDLTHARIRRALLHILLGIQEVPPAFVPISYLRVLGFRQQACPLLSAMKKCAQAPIITKMADARRRLSPEAWSDLQMDIYAADCCRLLRQTRSGDTYPNEFTRGIILIARSHE